MEKKTAKWTEKREKIIETGCFFRDKKKNQLKKTIFITKKKKKKKRQ
jgi:hypothetical protein